MACRVALPRLPPSSRERVLGGGAEEFEIVVEDVLDAEENVAEAGAAHERRQGFTVAGDGRGHGLDEVVELVEPGVDDGFAQGLEAAHVESDVVVDEENSAGAVTAGVADVVEHAIERIGVEVAAAHFNDGAEAAVVGAAARGFDDIDLASEQGVAAEHARGAVGQADFAIFQAMHRASRVVPPAVAIAVGETADGFEAAAVFSRARSSSRKVTSPSPRTM